MRAIGSVSAERDAHRLIDYLLTLGIASKFEQASDGFTVWVRDEDKLAQAKEEFTTFLADPTNDRYDRALPEAQRIRRQEMVAELTYRRNVHEVRSLWQRPVPQRCPLTVGLISVCVLVAVLSQLGELHEPILNLLYMTPVIEVNGREMIARGLPEIRRGEVWRLFTPMFIHFGVPHLLFNMWNLYSLSGLIETHRGVWRLAMLVLFSALVSNVSQLIYSGPLFGGMSGVLYALFGYVWMKSRYDRSAGMFMPRETVTLMIAWFFLCMTGAVGPIANAAHVAGFAVGVAVGYAPVWWRRVTRGLPPRTR
jgi:GlpG protein